METTTAHTDSRGNALAVGSRVRVTAHGGGVPQHLRQGTYRVERFTRTGKAVIGGINIIGTYNVPTDYLLIAA